MKPSSKDIARLFLPMLLMLMPVLIFSGCKYKGAPNSVIEKTFPNGFKVILKENHASPMIASIVMVNAGSKFENDATNGFTHLLEHLNFDGTSTKSRIDINEGIKNHGGYINAFTRKDATTYLILMPSEFIDFGLDIQSDQLFGSTFPEDEFEKERQVVTEEIRKDYDDLNYRVEMFNDSLVFASTPYARTVLGSPKSIAEVSRQAVIDYYKSQYTPEKMLAIAIGDFNPDSMLALYQKYFGSRPRGTQSREVQINYSFPASGQIHYRQTDTKVSTITITYPAPDFRSKDYYAFEMLTMILNANETSPLYKALTEGEKPLIQSLSVSLDTKTEFTNMVVSAMTDDAANADEILKITNKSLQDMTSQTIDPEELNRFIVKAKVDEYLLEERLHYWGIIKAPYLAVGGYGFVKSYIDNLSAVTPEEVRKAAATYLSDLKYIATAVVPNT